MIEKLNAILALFTPERPEWLAADVAQALSIPRSTSYRLLSRIAGAGFIDNDRATGRYRIGLRVAALGMLAQRSTALQRAAHPVLQRLSWESHEAAILLLRNGSHADVVLVADGPRAPILLTAPGLHTLLHQTAGGRAIMSTLPDEERRTLLRGALSGGSLGNQADSTALEADLAQARVDGWAVTHTPWLDMECAIGSPVRSGARSSSAAVVVAGPRSRMSAARLHELGPMLVSAAAAIALALRSSEAGRADIASQRTAAD